MFGADYSDLGDFVYSCRKKRQTLDVASVLGKGYWIDELRELIASLDIDIPGGIGYGVSKRYSLAQEVSKKVTADTLGDKLSWFDHERHLPVTTFYRLPNNEEFLSYNNFAEALSLSLGIEFDDGFYQHFNGITEPPPHSCLLESVRLFEGGETVSILFSCTRALVRPDQTMANFSNLFLARIPVLIRVFFEKKLVEFSIPPFSEPIADEFSYAPQAPLRYQEAFRSAYIKLNDLIPAPLKEIRFDDLPLWLETEFAAEDMGWKIAPQVEADFDLTQNLVPLKEILGNFISSLERECASRGASHKLQGVDLYHVFRSLKNESYTYSMVQKIPFGKRGRGLLLTILYGSRDSSHYPIMLLANYTETSIEKLRDAVSKLFRARIKNPYSIDSLFVEKD